MQATFEHALNDGPVVVHYYYDWDNVECCDIEWVEYCGQDVTAIVNPEDHDYLLSRCPEKAREHKAAEEEDHA